MEQVWYYVVEGERNGPLTFDELRELAASGGVSEHSLVWQPEFGQEWRTAGRVEELFSARPHPAPPAPPIMGVSRELSLPGPRPSCARALSQAWSHSMLVLFKPFNLGRWLSIGVCAWLSLLGKQISFNPGEIGILRQQGGWHDLKHIVDRAFEKVASLSLPFGTAEITGVAVALLVALVLCKIRSRGDFMMLYRWYHPDLPVRQCWAMSRTPGHDLFVWRVYLFMIVALLLLIDGMAAVKYVVNPYLSQGRVWSAEIVTRVIWFGAATTMLLITVQGTLLMTRDFVIPVMHSQGVGVARGWRVTMMLCNQHPFAVINYFICGALATLGFVVVWLIFGTLTCCLGFVPFLLPYFSAVAMLPYLYFYRGYSLCFLNQWQRGDVV